MLINMSTACAAKPTSNLWVTCKITVIGKTILQACSASALGHKQPLHRLSLERPLEIDRNLPTVYRLSGWYRPEAVIPANF